MSATFELRVGDRGRVVLPAALRRELGLRQGDVLSVTLQDGQLVASTPRAALERVRERVRGTGAVEELLADRHRQAEAEPHACCGSTAT
ncbi:MAG: AbrB/MazE/SpoVT family DNA-binding domain-containing protein [Propionibacteriaceae bacterium]|nr:AbrB/MazE/SpoVT family DNA-binding domain-containing protein [Propionibacteriaceae bacterium]